MPRGLMRGGVLIVDEDLAAGGAFDERDQLQNAALARARMAGQEGQFAGVDLEGHAGERLAAVGVALVNLVEADHAAAPSGPDLSSAETNSGALNTPKSSLCSPTPTKRMGIFSFCGDGEHHAALGGAVELGDDQPGHPQALVEFARPARPRSGRWCRREPAAPHAAPPGSRRASTRLTFLSSSMRCVWVCRRPAVSAIKTSTLRAPRGLQAVEDDRGGLRAGLLGDDGHLVALGPDLQLLARRRAKGVAGGEHDAVAFGEQPVRQFADGGGLAGAVDSDHQNDVGLDVRVDGERLFHGLQDIEHGLAAGP